MSEFGVWKTKNKGDLLIPALVVFLALFGVIMVYSASSYTARKNYGDSFFFARKQLVGVLFGIVAMVAASRINLSKIKAMAFPSVIISVVLLLLVFVPGVGVENYGAKRWIGLFGITIQPSEFAKFSLVLFFAKYISAKPYRLNRFVGILPIMGVGAIFCVLIMLQPNMSITVCIAATMFALLFAGGVKIKYLLAILAPFMCVVLVLILLEPYRLSRLMAFLDPWASPRGEGYQLLQSLYSLGSGGWFGVGLFSSRQKYSFLPFSESDFILSIIGEELGFVGVSILFVIMFILIYRCARASIRAGDLFGYFTGIGITFVFGIQTLLNVLVVSGSIPPTGLSLPLISSGNTSIIVFFFAFGIIYNISKTMTKTD